MKKRKLFGTVMISGIFLLSAVCSAASWKSYDTIVERFNGSGYSGIQTASTSGWHTAWLDSFTVGGNYVVDARVQGYSGSYKAAGPWERNITDNTLYFLQNSGGFSFTKGRIEFSNDLTTPVNVQVTGEFKLND